MKKLLKVLLVVFVVSALALTLIACNQNPCKKNGHKWGDGNVTTEATCTQDGVKTYTCSQCKQTRTETITKLGHDKFIESEDAATCAAAKVEHWACHRCDWTDDVTVGDPLGHKWGEWGNNTATCTADGTETRTCERDGCDSNEGQPAEETRPTSALNHDEYLVSTTAATCITAEVQHWACHRCNDWTDDRTVGTPNGHSYPTTWTVSETAGKHYRTCTRCDYIERKDCDSIGVINGVAATCTKAGKEAGTKCSVCGGNEKEGATIPASGHSWSTLWSSNTTQHWKTCSRCDAITAQGDHNFGEYGHDLTCSVCTKPRPGENYVLTYTIDGEQVQQSYRRLADAIAFIAEYEEVNNVVINVNDEDKTLEGLGVVIPSGLNITINLNGSTYIVEKDPVGSAGTETNGFQILKDSNITIENGTITSAKGSGVKMLIQNYANLTLNGVTLDGTNLDLDPNAPNYTLSINCGEVELKNYSIIFARAENGVALDVWYNMGGKYPEGINVDVNKTCRINGVIEYGSAVAGADLKNKAVLSLPDGTYGQLRYTANVPDCVSTGIKINNQPLTAHWSDWEITSEPSCTEQGAKERHCTLCGKLDTDTIDTIPHEIETGLAEYFGGHQHEGLCSMCEEFITENCTIVGDSCTICGRIVGIKSANNVATITISDKDTTNGTAVTTITADTVTVTFAKGSASSAPAYYSPSVRMYNGNTLTIAVERGLIINIEFTFESSSYAGFTYSGSVGKLTKNTASATWTDEIGANSLAFSANSSRAYVKSIVITYSTSSNCYHEGENVLQYKTVTSATCTETGIAKACYYCTNCDSYFTTQDCTALAKNVVIAATGHTYGELIKVRSATCELPEYLMDHYYCEACGTYFNSAKEKVEESAVIGSTVDHTWGDWTDNDNGTHTRTCSFGVHTETKDCTLDESAWVYDADGHWHECALCGYIFVEGYDEHDGMGDGVCDTCGYSNTAVKVTVSVVGGAEGLITTNLTQQAEVGTEISFTVAVADGYRLISVVDANRNLEIERNDGAYKYTFVDDSVVDGEVVVTITIIKQVTVTLSDVANGSIAVTYGENVAVATGDKVDVGTELTITVTADTGYQVTSVSVNDEAITNGKYTIAEDTTATTITIAAVVEENVVWTFKTNLSSDAPNDITAAGFARIVQPAGTMTISSISKVYSGAGNTLKFASNKAAGSCTLTINYKNVQATKLVFNGKSSKGGTISITVTLSDGTKKTGSFSPTSSGSDYELNLSDVAVSLNGCTIELEVASNKPCYLTSITAM